MPSLDQVLPRVEMRASKHACFLRALDTPCAVGAVPLGANLSETNAIVHVATSAPASRNLREGRGKRPRRIHTRYP